MPIPVFRVEKNANYTTMSNYHLRDNTISFKAKGLLSMFLSLPKDWSYSVKGIATISKEGVDGILSGLKELEAAGYLERHRMRNDKGRLGDSEYVIYEMPHRIRGSPELEKPNQEKPVQANPVQVTPEQEKPVEENPAQLNIEVINKDKQNGYEVRRGKFISVRGKGQQRFIRLCSLGEGYTEEDIQAVISGTKQHHFRKKKPVILENQKFKLLVEIDERIRAKGPGYQRWATAYNLKQMAKTRIFLKEQGVGSIEELREKADTTAFEFDRIAKDLKAAEQRLVEIAALKKHIVNYAKTRDAYIAYRKAGYSKTFFEAHREEITLHKAAKDAFEKMNVSKLPNVKALSEEYASTLTQKKALYAQYRLAREQMQEYQKALHNTEVFFELSEKEAACHQREHEKENSEEPNHS